ncbi:MAG: hypothetical protein AB7P49_12590, partial [Bdellovibrionales bacterium]
GPGQLIAHHVKIRAIPTAEDSNWMQYLIELEMEPYVRTKRANGDWHREKVPDGDFLLEMQVLGTEVGPDMNQKVLLLKGEQAVHQAKARNGILKAELRMTQKVVANQSNLELAVRVRPRSLNAYKTPSPFNGLFRFGIGERVSEHNGPLALACEDQTLDCSYDKILASAANYNEVAKGYLRPNVRYSFSNLKLRFVAVMAGETATQRTVAYSASTCVTDLATGKPLTNTPMTVDYHRNEKEDQGVERNEIAGETDESGCLTWNGKVKHRYYGPEKYFERKVTIGKGGRFKRDFTFYLNPWDDKFTFGWDAREFDPEFFEEIRARHPIKSRFFLGGFQYHTVRFLYNIDPFMELEVKKTILMMFEPRVLRYSGIVNARRTTEALRDGIYLMKVAIQKNYLDPRDNSGWKLINTPQFQAELVREGGRQLVAREYVSTNVALVRIVDGLMIYPIELTMRDLRLMRTRANFLIQLEAVDERLIQAYHVFKEQAIKGEALVRSLEQYKQAIGEKKKNLNDVTEELGGDVSPGLEPVVKKRLETEQKQQQAEARGQTRLEARKELEAKTLRVKEIVRHNLHALKEKLESGNAVGNYLDGLGNDQSRHQILNDPVAMKPFAVNDPLLTDVQTAMKTYDFSEIRLPKKADIDLNIFLEKDSGLKRRTFVGPVIFLSNGYSDSVRATDNLDEAACVDPDKGQDPLDASIETLALNSYEDRAARLLPEQLDDDKLLNSNAPIPKDPYQGRRMNNAFDYNVFFGRSRNVQNNDYEFNPNYGALTHLCYKDVDDLIKREKELHDQWIVRYRAMSLKHNFVTSFPFQMEFVSLTNEPLIKVQSECKAENEEQFQACLVETNEHKMSLTEMGELLNHDLRPTGVFAEGQLENVMRLRNEETRWSSRTRWEPADYSRLFFERSTESHVGLCNLLSNKIERNMKRTGLNVRQLTGSISWINKYCNREGGLVHDIKLHVGETGKYRFLGGLNLNFNVGESFGFDSRYSVSGDFDLTDLLGPLVHKLPMGWAAKSIGLKYGMGDSSGDGTSVSESTYLVAQIAKFELILNSYERCAVVRLADGAVGQLMEIVRGAPGRETSRAKEILRSGLFVCEGAKRVLNKPRSVEEMYFYFTQHFTEGDMLDQADLYNHPWLLALRGIRDFTVFVKGIRAQEVVGLGAFLSRVVGYVEKRPVAWALDHLYKLYQNKLPSFPGYYTVLDEQEDIRAFVLQQSRDDDPNPKQQPRNYRLRMRDVDPLGEVQHSRLQNERAR